MFYTNDTLATDNYICVIIKYLCVTQHCNKCKYVLHDVYGKSGMSAGTTTQ